MDEVTLIISAALSSELKRRDLIKTPAEKRLIVAAIALVEKLGLKGGETWQAVQAVKTERIDEQT